MTEADEASNPAKHVISAAKIHVNLTPYAFHHFAMRFRDVARIAEVSSGFSPVPYYLYCRALELSLKAFLLLNGITKQQIMRKDLGHDLIRNLERAQTLGLSKIFVVSEQQRAEVEKANSYYVGKDFEYANVMRAVKAYPALPDLIVLDRLVDNLLVVLKPLCLAE
jgi:hypothetical protein